MANCIEFNDAIKILKMKIPTSSIKEAGKDTQKKDLSFDTHDITPEMYYDLFANKKDSKNNSAWTNIKKAVNNNNIINKLFPVKSIVGSKNMLFDDLIKEKLTGTKKEQAKQKQIIGGKMMVRALAMKHVLGTINSEADIQDVLGISAEDAAILFTDGSRNISSLGMSSAIGREIAYSMGFAMDGNPAQIKQAYQQIGQNALAEIEENTGLLINGEGAVLNNKMYSDRFNKYSDDNIVGRGEDDAFPIVRLNLEMLGFDEKHDGLTRVQEALDNGKSTELMAKQFKDMKDLGILDATARYVHRMAVPSNLHIAESTNPGLSRGKGITMSGISHDFLKKMQNSPAYFNPRAGSFFLHLNEEVQKAIDSNPIGKTGADFESILKDVFGKDKELLTFVFGTFDESATTDTKQSAVGQALSKSATIKTMIESAHIFFNPDGSPTKQFYEHEMYRTGRVGFLQTIGNAQTDKFFSRFMLDGGEYHVSVASPAYKQLVNGIRDDSGLNVNHIRFKGKNQVLDAVIDMYDSVYNSGLTGDAKFRAEKKFFKILKDGRIKVDGKFKNVPGQKGSLWQNLSVYEGVSDIRKAKNGTVNTRYQTKPDATGSGIILQLLQMIGLPSVSAGAQGHLESLRIMTPAEEKQFVADVYDFMQNAIKRDQEDLQVESDKPAVDFIKGMVDTGFVNNMRDIAKPPTMVTSYLAGKATVIANMAKEYLKSIRKIAQSGKATQEQLDFMLDMLEQVDDTKINKNVESIMKKKGTSGKKAQDIMNIPGIDKAMEGHIRDVSGEYMFGLIEESLTGGSITQFHKKFKTLYDQYAKLAMVQDELIDEGKADPSTRIEIKTLPAQIAVDLATKPDDDSWFKFHWIKVLDEDGNQKLDDDGIPMEKRVRKRRMTDAEILNKYGMKITSENQIITDVGDDRVSVTGETSNYLTSIVNVIHSMDSAIMFTAHRNTYAEIEGLVEDLEGKMKKVMSDSDKWKLIQLREALAGAKFSIHDANNASAVYNEYFQKHYRKATGQVFSQFDMFEQLLDAYELAEDSAHPDNEARLDATEKKALRKESNGSLKRKKQMLNDGKINLDSEKIFGFKDDYDYSAESKEEEQGATPEPTESSKKKVVETSTSPKIENTTEGFKSIDGLENREGSLPKDPKDITGEVEDFYDEQTKRIDEIIENEEEFVAIDLENTYDYVEKDEFGSEVSEEGIKYAGLHGLTEILEFFGKKVKYNKKKGSFDELDSDHIENKPSDPESYDSIIEKTEKKKGVKYKSSDEFGGESYNPEMVAIALADSLKKLTNDWKLPIMAYNGFKADFKHLSQHAAIKDMLDNLEVLDAMIYSNNKQKHDISEDKKANPDGNYARRDQAWVADKLGVDSGSTHDAAADVNTMLGIVSELSKDESLNSKDNKKSKQTGKTKSEPVETVIERIKDYSPIIETFLDGRNKAEVIWSNVSRYVSGLNKILLNDDTSYSDEEIAKHLEHEIVHYNTVGFMALNPNDIDVKYMNAAVKYMKKNKSEITARLKTEGAKETLEYVTSQSNDFKNVAELTAIARVEHSIMEELADAMNKKPIVKKADSLLAKVISFAKAGKMNFNEFSKESLIKSAMNIDEKGVAMNTSPSMSKIGRIEATKKLKGEGLNAPNQPVSPERKAFMKKMGYKKYTPESGSVAKTGIFENFEKVNNFASSAMASMIFDPQREFRFKNEVEALDEFMTNNFPVYSGFRNKTVDFFGSSSAMQQMHGYFNSGIFGNRLDAERLMALQDKATQERGTIDNALIKQMEESMSGFTQEEHELVYAIFSEAPSFRLMDGDDKTKSTMYDLVMGNVTLDEVISQNQAGLDNRKIEIINKMVRMLSGDKNHRNTVYDAYNLDDIGLNAKDKAKIGKAVAAKMMQKHDSQSAFKLMRENTEVYNLIVDATLGLKNSYDRVYSMTKDPRRYRENLIVDVYEEEYDIEAVNYKEYRDNIYKESDGWMVLRKPSANSYGLVYRKAKDETWQEGATTSLSYKNTDVIVPLHKQIPNSTNVISTDIGRKEKRHKVVLTAEEKSQLGLKRSVADSVYRSISRMSEIEETQTGRDLLLTAEFTKRIHGKPALVKFDEMLGSMDKEDRKWMIGFRDKKGNSMINIEEVTRKHMSGTKKGQYVYSNIMKYYKVPERASSVSGFRHNFDLVRIDAEPWLMGYKDPVIFENYPPARKAAYVIRQLVKNTKIVWTALSPTKIINDNISNGLILMGYDVPPSKVGSYGKKAWKEIGEFEKLRMAHVSAKVHGNKKLEAKLAREIHDHPMNMLLQNGMLQSINIELYQRDSSVVSGLQKDIEELLNEWVLLPEGKKSSIFTAIEALQNFGGMGIESALEFAGKNAKNVDALESLGKQLEASGGKLADMKKKIAAGDDKVMAKYVSEFLMTPSSEAVQFGSMLVQRADIVARAILVRHLMDTGTSEEEAIIIATDAFINYKQNMPKGLKLVSDYGILLFPSFWIRAHKVMASLLMKNPATAIGGAAASHVIGLDVSTIFDANVLRKIDNGSLLNTPPIFGWFQ